MRAMPSAQQSAGRRFGFVVPETTDSESSEIRFPYRPVIGWRTMDPEGNERRLAAILSARQNADELEECRETLRGNRDNRGRP